MPTPTIKHYMREGLLPGPERRTSRNMAYYDARLAERVKVIKELQQTRFLPLKIISDLLEPPPSSEIRGDLDAIERAQLGSLEPAIRAGSNEARRRRGDDSAEPSRTRGEVLAKLAVSADDVAALEALGLIEVAATDEHVYRGAELEVLEVISQVRENGMGELFPMPILEPYVAAVRTLVRVEIELFRRRVLEGASLPPMSLEDIARQATSLGERLVVAMREKLLIPELHAAAAPRDERDLPEDAGDTSS